MTQPAVTFQIKQLEDHLNVRLLDRGHGKITLTSAGELVLAYAEQILDLSDELDARVSELADELAGQLNIGCIPAIASYWLPPVLERFKRRYPRVLPRVVLGNSRIIEEGIIAREVDIGFIEVPTEHPGIEPRVATQEELVVICSPTHPLAGHARLTARELVDHPFIDRDPGSGMRQAARDFFAAAGIAESEINLCAELGSLTAVKQFVAAGLGFAITSKRASRIDVREGRMAVVPLEPRTFTTLQMILPRDKFRSRLITTFADFVCDEIARIAEEEEGVK
jgi:DNA-binding transcriptional LysR family regulator